MTDATSDRPQAEQPGPTDRSDPVVRHELRRASAWIGLGVAVILLWWLAQPLLLIFGGLVFAAMLEGGTRLLGRVLPIRRGLRLAIVCLAVVAFVGWTAYFTGSEIAGQAEGLRSVVMAQTDRLFAWGNRLGLMPQDGGGGGAIAKQLMGSLGQVTAAVGTALGAVSSIAMIVVIGLFIAIEPRLYERGIAWMLPMAKRDGFYRTSAKMGHTMRRLMFGRLIGMAVEGVFTGVALGLVGVPMAALLGILTGLLAFLPNIGAIVSGGLIVLVGFSAGTHTGLWAIAIYCIVQLIDGYVIVPMVARRSVDLAPALVLGAQILFGALFGIVGLALADPMVAMIKVMLEQLSGERSEGSASKG